MTLLWFLPFASESSALAFRVAALQKVEVFTKRLQQSAKKSRRRKNN